MQKEVKESKGTGDHLYINMMLLEEIKQSKKNLAMGWVNYRAKNVVIFFGKSMKSWRVEVTHGTEHPWKYLQREGFFKEM